MEVKFFRCSHCGEMVVPFLDTGGVPFCCGEMMGLLVPNSTDAAGEKHAPVVEREEDGKHIRVSIGSVPHPMEEEHYIKFLAIAHGVRVYSHWFSPGDEPMTRFVIKDNTVPVTAYEYCNLHGLWKTEI